MAAARLALLEAAWPPWTITASEDEAAARLREAYTAERAAVEDGHHPRAVIASDHLRRESLTAKRRRLALLRQNGEIDDDVFHALEQELDWAELAASPPERFELVEG